MSDADRRGDTRRTFIGSVVCIDLVGYSKRSVAQQRSVKVEFNRILTQTLRAVPEEDRIILDTGDGVSITFLGDPDECFATALRIRDGMNACAAALGGDEAPIRIGINFGSIKFTRDLNGRPNVVGDSVSGAARIVSHARPGQIVVSRSFHGMVSRPSDGNVAAFTHVGVATDRSGHSDDVYSVADSVAPSARRVHPGAATLRINRKAQRTIAAALVAMGVVVAGAWLLLRKTERAPDVTGVAPAAEAPRAEVPVAPPAPAPSIPARAEEPPIKAAEKPPGKIAGQRDIEPRASPSPSKAPEPPAPLAERSPASTKDLARPAAEAPRSPSLATPVSREQPRFPAAAVNDGVERGAVHARLEIDASGNVTEVHILSADPPRVFNREAIRALRNWRFDSGNPGRTYEVSLEFGR